MRLSLLLIPFFIITAYIPRQDSLPQQFVKVFNEKQLNQLYEPKRFLDPLYFDEDFSGDGVTDIAFLIIEKSTKKKGIIIINGKTNEHFIFGAGTKFGNGLDNFESAERWGISYAKEIDVQVIDKKTGKVTGIQQKQLKHEALIVDDSSEGKNNVHGFIHWNGKTYEWIFQGF